MLPKLLPRVEPGDEIKAEHHNALVDALVEQNLIVSGSGGLIGGSGPFGTSLTVTGPKTIWLKLTGRLVAAYAWTEVYPATGGTWTNSTNTGTTTVDPAYEANGNTAIVTTTPYYVEAKRNTAGAMMFRAGSC